MATLALSSAGAAIGAEFGYAAVGWAVGSMLGNYLFAPDAPDVEGPRLNDLRVQSAAYGQAKPETWGSMRQAGQIIHSTKIQETKHEEDVGGGKGGGGGGTQTTYTYSITMAVAFGEGPIDAIRRIWANGKLIWTQTENDSAVQLRTSADGVDVYLGTETQEPDATLESLEGPGNVPAYRGTVYAVFDEFQLEDFGNSPPHFEAEVVRNGAITGPRRISLTTHSNPNDWDVSDEVPLIHDVNDGLIQVSTWEDGVGDHTELFFDLDGNIVDQQVLSGKVIQDTYNFYYGRVGFSTNNTLLAVEEGVDGYGVAVYRWGPAPDGEEGIEGSAFIGFTHDLLPSTTNLYSSFNGGLYVPERGGNHIVAYSGIFPGETWWLIRISGSVLTIERTGTVVDEIKGGDDGQFGCLESNLEYFWTAPNYGDSVKCYRLQDDGDLVAATSEISFFGGAFSEPNIYADNGIATAFKKQYVGVFTRLSVAANDGIQLSEIVGDLCEDAGLSATDYDATELTDTVTGYTRTRVMTARRALEPLQRVFYFDVVESDWQLKFVKRGGASVVTIPEDDLAAHQAGNDMPSAIEVQRQQEVELPREMRLKYPDVDADYNEGAQRSQRLITESEHVVDVDVPIALSNSKAAEVVEVLMYDLWTARQSQSISVGPQYEYLDPGDVITISEDGNTHTLRIVRQTNRGVLDLQCVSEDVTVYTSDAPGFDAPPPQSTIRVYGPTNLILIDAPILRDADNNAGFYAAANGYYAGWPGAVLYTSASGESYSQTKPLLTGAIIGTTTDTLSDGPTTIIDESNTVNIRIPQGSLASITDTELLDGESNTAAIGNDATGWEIIQFRDATLESDGTYTVSHLVRGRRGTEWMTDQHSAGDRFILLESSKVERILPNTDTIGSTRYYKGVTLTKPIATASEVAFANDAVGLKPFSPVHLAATDNGDGTFDVTWIRRGRIAGEWRDYVDVPLGEDSESYRVKVFSGGTEQSSTDVTSESATVTAVSGDTIKVAQLSATVGPGYYSEITI